MQFLNPIWFLAAAALAIPVVIHLWNIRPGRVLKVGSISLMKASSRKSSKSFKLNDILLLVLRCLFLLLLALLFAMPVIEQHLQIPKIKGWVLIPKENFYGGYKFYKTSIDSLIQRGYEFHFFDDSLPKADLVQLLKDKKLLPTDTSQVDTANYWSLIKQLDTKIAADVPVYIYTPNTAKHFNGDRPNADLNLHWQTFNEADSTSLWVQGAWFTNGKNIRVVKGTANKNGINFEYLTLPPDKGNSQFTLDVKNGQAKVGLAGIKNSTISVDTSVMRIAIYTDRFQADAGYLKAALDAASSFSQKQVIIKQYNNPSAIPTHQNWVFWLSGRPIPTALLSRHVKIFAYQNGKQNATASNIIKGNIFALPFGEAQPAVFKTINNQALLGPLWHDGYGHPILSVSKLHQAVLYNFSSRFNPGWSDLVWDNKFPEMLLQLIFNTDYKDFSRYDKRAISLTQLQPAKTNKKNIISNKFFVKKDLVAYFWLNLILVFFAERWLATSNKTAQQNG